MHLLVSQWGSRRAFLEVLGLSGVLSRFLGMCTDPGSDKAGGFGFRS